MDRSDCWHAKTYGDPDNPAILFLHGFMGCGEDWTAVIQGLMIHYFCITVDLPGHEKTRIWQSKRDYAMPGAAKNLIHMLADLRIRKCIVVGYSMGGRLALYLALHYPDRFFKGVLESASPGLSKREDRLARIAHDEKLASELESVPFATFLRKWYSQPIFESLKGHPDFPDLLKRRQGNIPADMALSLRHMGTGKQPSQWARLRHNRVPLLFMTGELDGKFRAIASRMEGMCPYSRTKIIAGCGHNIHFENPSAFIESVKAFIEE
ncbi:MAG: 2-succinyl-6-hydroxy-2,4-cyclohexadiene-1-carboxylate synthase [bacterium]